MARKNAVLTIYIREQTFFTCTEQIDASMEEAVKRWQVKFMPGDDLFDGGDLIVLVKDFASN